MHSAKKISIKTQKINNLKCGVKGEKGRIFFAAPKYLERKIKNYCKINDFFFQNDCNF